MKRSAEYLIALLVDLIAAAGVLLIGTRTWQVITTPRPAPLRDDVLPLTGRTVDAASTALALVALAGVVAVLATRGIVRRIVGVVLALAGAGLVWRAVVSSAAVSRSRARALVHAHHRTVTFDPGVQPHVTVHPVWPLLSLICGVLVMATGILIAWRGARWSTMSARYESRPGGEAEPDSPRAAATMWNAFDRGDDPTAREDHG